jgi:hypothetical protein
VIACGLVKKLIESLFHNPKSQIQNPKWYNDHLQLILFASPYVIANKKETPRFLGVLKTVEVRFS